MKTYASSSAHEPMMIVCRYADRHRNFSYSKMKFGYFEFVNRMIEDRTPVQWMQTIRMDGAIIPIDVCEFLSSSFTSILIRLMWYVLCICYYITVIRYYEWFWPRFNDWLTLFTRTYNLWIFLSLELMNMQFCFAFHFIYKSIQWFVCTNYQLVVLVCQFYWMWCEK